MELMTVVAHVTAYEVPQMALYTIFAFLLGVSFVLVAQSLPTDRDGEGE